jgi:hypothetical protein
VNLQHGVVRRHGLEGDIAVPPVAGEPANVGELVGQAAALFLLLGRDDADLITQLRALFRQGVDVQARRFWRSGEAGQAQHQVLHLNRGYILVAEEHNAAL